MLRRLALLAIAMVGAVVASPTGVRAQTDTPVIAPQAIEVLRRGAKPRLVFAYFPEAGSVARGTYVVEQDVENYGNGVIVASSLVPGITLRVETTIAEATEGGFGVGVSYPSFEVEPGTSEPDQIASTEQLMTAMTQTSASYSLSPTGIIVEARLALPDGLDLTTSNLIGELTTKLGSLAPPFPEVPIGRGARWRVTTEYEVIGIRVTQRSDYEMLNFSETGEFSLRRSVLTTAKRGQQVVFPGDESPSNITEHTVKARGTLSGALGVMMPLKSTISGTETLRATGTVEGGPFRFKLVTRSKVTLVAEL